MDMESRQKVLSTNLVSQSIILLEEDKRLKIAITERALS
jgi:predicted solute-binding protein